MAKNILGYYNNKQQQKVMGNQQCRHECANLSESQAYGAHEIVKQETHFYAVVTKRTQKSQNMKEVILKQLQKRKQLQSTNISKLCKYAIIEQGNCYKAVMHYQYIPKTLRDRIDEVKFQDSFFSQRQIFSVIYSVQSALDLLSGLGIKHCCINLDTILLKNNVYKITDVSSTTYVTSYGLACIGQRQQFLSQRLIQSIAHESLHPLYLLEDDLFSLGMIAIVLATMDKVLDFYHWNEKNQAKMDRSRIQNSLKFIQKKYSKKLAKKIKSLLEPSQNSDEKSCQNMSSRKIDEVNEEMLNKTVSFNSTVVTQSKNSSMHGVKQKL